MVIFVKTMRCLLKFVLEKTQIVTQRLYFIYSEGSVFPPSCFGRYSTKQSNMLARLLIPLCLCCVVLCAFVGFLSKRAIDETAEIASKPKVLDCRSFIDNPPKRSSGILLSKFVFVDRIATIDSDRDGKWDEVAIPLFSRDGFKSRAGYTAVIACFRDVPDLETLHERLAANELEVNYRANDQRLGRNLHTQLAIKFKNMDFQYSPVVTIGYGQENPVLGQVSLKLSYTLGAIAIGVAALTLVCLAFASLFKSVVTAARTPRKRRKPKKIRAGLPNRNRNYENEPTGGVLDKIRSMRDQPMSS